MLTQKRPPNNRANWTIEQWLLFAQGEGLAVTVTEGGLEIGPDEREQTIRLGADCVFDILPTALSMLGLDVYYRKPE